MTWINLPLAILIAAGVAPGSAIALSGSHEAASPRDHTACWQMTSTGTNTGSLTQVTHPGRPDSVRLTVARLSSGSRSALVNRGRASCVSAAIGGLRYNITFWYESAKPARLTTFYRDAQRRWHRLGSSPLAAHRTSAAVTAATPSLPLGATAVTFGVTMTTTGMLTLDRSVVRAVLSPAPAPTSRTPSPAPVAGVTAATIPSRSAGAPTTPPTTSPAASPTASASPEASPAGLVVTVSTAAQLTAALAAAKPGETITMADGTYKGNFTATTPGTASAPIRLTGSRNAVLDGGGVSTGYALHLDGADYWVLSGFSAGDAQKAVVLDETSHASISNLNLHHTGDEILLLRNFSRYDLVSGNTIYDSGLVDPGYGEGVYVGLAKSNWSSTGQSRTGGAPDTSDYVTIIGNNIHDTTAENVDIKEGTTGGVISDNTFNSHNMSGANYADSWVDLAGNGYTVTGNIGTNPGGALVDGYQTHVILSGWARNNVFSDNTSAVNAAGYGFDIQTSGTGNVVRADNTVTGAGKGISNIPLTP